MCLQAISSNNSVKTVVMETVVTATRVVAVVAPLLDQTKIGLDSTRRMQQVRKLLRYEENESDVRGLYALICHLHSELPNHVFCPSPLSLETCHIDFQDPYDLDRLAITLLRRTRRALRMAKHLSARMLPS